jgi:hypothetical protein
MLPKQSKGNERTKMVVVRECLSNQENMSNENASTRWFTKLKIRVCLRIYSHTNEE